MCVYMCVCIYILGWSMKFNFAIFYMLPYHCFTLYLCMLYAIIELDSMNFRGRSMPLKVMMKGFKDK